MIASGKPGCLTISFGIGLTGIAGAVYLMSRWASLGGLGKAGSVMLVVLGTLLCLPLVLITGLGLFLRHMFGRMTRELSKAGESMAGQARAMYGKIHDFRPASDEDFAGLDRAIYDDASQTFTDAGYRQLGEVVDATIEQISGVSPVIRVFASADGSTTSGIYQFKEPSLSEPLLICDLCSEFEDGEFLLSSNTQGLDMMTPPPKIHRRQYHSATPLSELLDFHETEKQKLLAAKGPAARCRMVSTIEEALQSEKRQQAIKNAYRKETGSVQAEEVRRIASKVSDDSDKQAQ